MADFGKLVTIAAPVLTTLNPKLGQAATIAGGGIAAYNAPNFSVTQLVDGAAVVTNVAALVKPNDANIAMAAQVAGGAAALVTVAGKSSTLSGYVNTPLIGSATPTFSSQTGASMPILTTTRVDSLGLSQLSSGYEDASADKYAYATSSAQAAEALAVSVSPEGSIGYSAAGNGLQPLVYTNASPVVTAARAPIVSTNFSSPAQVVATAPSFTPTFEPGLTDAQQQLAGQMEKAVVQASYAGDGPAALAIAQKRQSIIANDNKVNSDAWLQAANSDGAGYTETPR